MARRPVAGGRGAGVRQRLVLGVDGGNSKADVWLVSAAGELLGAAHGRTASHQQVTPDEGFAQLGRLAGEAAGEAARATGDTALAGRRPMAEVGTFCLAGADYATDIRALRAGIEGLGLASGIEVLNDTFAGLRAGASRPWGISLVCGQGINAAGVGPNGRRVRFDAVGDISGDWGGGTSVGYAALAAAVRGRDGRGPRTSLERSVPAHFGLGSPRTLVRRLYARPELRARVSDLAPLAFEAATAGDPVARAIVDRLADELAVMAVALSRRLHVTRTDVEVVLAGGIFRATDAGFYERLDAHIRRAVRRVRIVRLTAPPVLGAALLALDRLGLARADHERAEARLRSARTA